MASHEFRTRLAIIDGVAQRVERRIDTIETPELEKRLSRIRGAVSRMLGLIESTLSASRLDEGRVALRPQEVDLAVLICTVCERQSELSDNLNINQDFDDLLIVSFNTSDMQAPMMARLLQGAAYPKVLMIPPYMANMDRLDSLPGFDATVRWPCTTDELQYRIMQLQEPGEPENRDRQAG